jgi:L-fuconolactonase
LRLDAHHSFSERYPLATLASILKRNRFEGSILVSEAAIAPGELAALPEFVRGVVVQAEGVDLGRLDEYQRDPRFRGLWCRPAYGLPALLGEIQRRNLTLDVRDGLASIPQIAGRFPALRMAIVHLGIPAIDHRGDWNAWAAALEAAAQAPAVCCKLSGLVSAQDMRPYVQHAMSVFGPGRLMFGSGWPANLPEHTWKESLAAFTQSIGARPIEVREQLLGATAARFYGIDQ